MFQYSQNPLIVMVEINKNVRINLLQVSETILQKSSIVSYDKSCDPPKPYNKIVFSYVFNMNNGNIIDSYTFDTEKEAEEWYSCLFDLSDNFRV